jgi:hypothetical protein
MTLGLSQIGATLRTAAPAPVRAEPRPDPLDLYRMSSQDRIRTETALRVEEARRALVAGNQARAEIRPTANFVDLRV